LPAIVQPFNVACAALISSGYLSHIVLLPVRLFHDQIIVFPQIPSIYWWYRTASHAAELTAGFYNPTNRDGYSPVFKMLKKHSVTLKIVCYGPEFTVQENDEAFADPEGLTWQVRCCKNSLQLH
jgi:beta-amylase